MSIEYDEGFRAGFEEGRKQVADKFMQWAIVELMGHQQCAGRVSEEVIGGAALVRVDVPDGKRDDGLESFRTSYFGASAIYAIHVVDEAAARASAASLGKIPPYAWRLEEGIKRLAAPEQDYDR
jgi:hypothetical protein